MGRGDFEEFSIEELKNTLALLVEWSLAGDVWWAEDIDKLLARIKELEDEKGTVVDTTLR